MSKRVEQILQVVEAVKSELGTLLEQFDCVSNEEVREILKKSFSNVANKNGIAESTVRDKCTRQIGCDTNIFFDEVIDNLIGGKKLANRVKKYSCSDCDDDVISKKL